MPHPLSPRAADVAPARQPGFGAEGGARLALVVFVDRTDGPWLKVLARGFRHCFAALRQDEGLWLICDPLKDRIEATVVETGNDLALAEAYLAMGHRVCLGWSRPGSRSARPPAPGLLTCVAVVKRLIGLRCRRIVTPYQLHRHLLGQRPVPWVDLQNRNLYLTPG